ncbi:MAG: GrpB family protein [Burkholderiales bacterium]|nr:MAG: GrpB family protein [Betaproteobacteria bacterium]TAG82948.1 MAG: GrpB family protein [Burkholderiales bacterium]
MSAVRVVAPDPDWSARFLDEAAHIRAALRSHSIEVLHIGSTSIRGIYAKPVIDMLLLVDQISVVDEASSALVQLGYEALGEFGISGRRYFRKDGADGTRTHQLHSFVRGSDDAKRHLAFRDYMNCHPSIAQEYSALKQRLAAVFPADMTSYMDGKDVFIKFHQARAMLEYTTA